MTALCSVFIHQEERPPGGMPLRESWVQPQFPSAAPRCSLQCNPSLLLLSLSVNGSGSWEPRLIHHFAPYFPSGHTPENNIFFLPFHSFRSCPDVLTLSSFFVPESESLHKPSLKLLQGCLGCSGLSCLDSSNASTTSREAPRQAKSVEHHHLLVEVVDACSLGCHHSWP